MRRTSIPVGEGLNVVYLHASGDEKVCLPLKTHLSMMRRNGFIEEWDIGELNSGEDRSSSIAEKIEEADLILLLVTPNFLHSDEVYDEQLNRAMTRHSEGDARVIPILMKSCDYTGASFSKLQPLPKDGVFVDARGTSEVDIALCNIAVQLRNDVEDLLEQRQIGVSLESHSNGASKERKQLVLTLDNISPEEFDEDKRKLLLRWISRVTGIDDGDIDVDKVEDGSTVVYLSLAEDAALSLYTQRNEAEVRRLIFPLLLSSVSFSSLDAEEPADSVSQLESSVEKLPMDGAWSLESLGDFSREFISLYSVMYGFQPDTPSASRYKFRRAFEKNSWDSGMVAGGFYSSVRTAVPAQHRVQVAAINYNSPGTLSLKLIAKVGQEVRDLVNALVAEPDVHVAYKEIYNAMSKQKKNLLSYDVSEVQSSNIEETRDISSEDATFVNSSYFSLAKKMKFPHAEFLLQLAGSRYAALKILMSLYRRAENLAKLERRNMLDY